jgi:ribosomal-protein-alanine N-acetyltransferase
LIRRALTTDLETIVELEEKTFGQSLGYAFLKQELLENDFSRIYVIEENNQIAGYISYRVVDDKSELLNFLIHEKYRQKGYGKKLFDFVINELKSEGVKTLILEVRVSNERAIKFYESYGFKEVLTITNYYQNEDGKVMLMEVL